MENEKKDDYKSIFVCPIHDIVSNEDVAFLCNTCQLREAKIIDGIYICPQCETALHPFTCRICESNVSWQTPLKTPKSV